MDFAGTNLAPRSEKCEKIEKGSAREFTQSLEIRGLNDGTPERIRTSDLVFRKHPLYPTELREHMGGDLPLGQR